MMRYLLFKQLKGDEESKNSCTASQMVAADTPDVIITSKYYQKCAPKKSKRFRSAFTTEQINYLEREFKKFPYIGSGNRKEVANKLNIPERAVKIWFQNRRMKEKKESVNKEVSNKDATAFPKEPLNNWQSNNEHRCSFFEQTEKNYTNYSGKSFNQATKGNSEKIYSINKPIANSKRGDAINFNKTTYAATKSSPVPVTCPTVKTKSNVTPVSLPKLKKISNAPSRNLNKVPASYCPLTKTNMNIDQDMPQDLSSRSLPQHQYPVSSIPDPGFVPLHIPNSFPSPVFPPGNVIWKPVNTLSTLPVPHTSAVPMGIPQNNPGVHLVNNHLKNSCNCNCHGSLVQCFNQVNTRAHPQYIIAIPFSNPTK